MKGCEQKSCVQRKRSHRVVGLVSNHIELQLKKSPVRHGTWSADGSFVEHKRVCCVSENTQGTHRVVDEVLGNIFKHLKGCQDPLAMFMHVG
jgi:hypothetical protein